MTDDVKQDKSGAPQCGLYLRIPENPDMEIWQPKVLGMRYVINKGTDYKRNMHVVEISLSEGASKDAVEKAAAFVQIAQLSGFVAIIKGSVAFAKMLESDGVLLSSIDETLAAREVIGDEKIIGLTCEMDGNLAETAVEQGVDYVTFGLPEKAPLAGVITKFTMATQQPCVSIGPITNKTAGVYVTAGTTFLDITHYLITSEKTPVQLTVNMMYEIDNATGSVKVN